MSGPGGHNATSLRDPIPSGRGLRPSAATWGLFAFAILGGVAIPLLMGAGERGDGGSDDDRLVENRRRIEAMTELERRRLRAWFDKFRELDESERDRFRRMHAAFVVDEELDHTLQTYRDWLETLTVLQRDGLRNESDPEARLNLVRQYREEQAKEAFERQEWLRRSGRFSGRGGWTSSRTTPEDVERVYTVLEQRLDLDTVLGGKPKSASNTLARHLLLLRESFARTEKPAGDGRVHWPPTELLEPIIAVLPKDLQEEVKGTKSDDGRRSRIAGALLGALWQEFFAELRRSNPRDEDLLAVYGVQPPAERVKLMGLRADETRAELQRLLMISKNAEFHEISELLRSQIRSFGPRPSDGRPGDGRPGDGRPSEGRPSEGRSGDGRSGEWRPGDDPRGQGRPGGGGQPPGPPPPGGRPGPDGGRGRGPNDPGPRPPEG